jgi:hypothetical protein
MTVSDLAFLMERHAKTKLAGDFSEYVEGHEWSVRALGMLPYFPDEDTATKEELQEAAEHAEWLAENPSVQLHIHVRDWGSAGQWGVNAFSMRLAEAEDCGEALATVLDHHLRHALLGLQKLKATV